MTTGVRITISEHTVRAMLAEWKAQRDAAEKEAGEERANMSRFRAHRLSPDAYAADLTPYVFSLLLKHAEASS